MLSGISFSMQDSKQAVKLYKDARLHIIPGAGHGFRPHEFKELVNQIKNFLKNKENKM